MRTGAGCRLILTSIPFIVPVNFTAQSKQDHNMTQPGREFDIGQYRIQQEPYYAEQRRRFLGERSDRPDPLNPYRRAPPAPANRSELTAWAPRRPRP